MSKYFGLPLQVHFGVDVGCVDGNMAQPCADGVDVDSRAKQVRCGRMSDRVWADCSVQKCRVGTCGCMDVLAEHPMNTVPSDRLPQTVQKDCVIWRAVAD